MKDLSLLSNIDPNTFFKQYEAAFVDDPSTDGHTAPPQKAIMVHLVKDDKLAAQVTGGILILIVSIAAKLLDTSVIES
jgi:hypothetical protein